MQQRLLRQCLGLITASFFLAGPRLCEAAQTSAAIIVRESGVYLYARQNVESDRIARLEKGEALMPMAEAVGVTTWYLVTTSTGLAGWVRGSDVTLSHDLQEAFRSQEATSWSARANDGRIFEGTWWAEPGGAADKAAGTWTLQDVSGKTLSRGRWSAEKFSTGWNGTWSATAEGRDGELTGTWTADFAGERQARFSEFFQAAARDVIRGIWNSENNSGSWSIRGKQ